MAMEMLSEQLIFERFRRGARMPGTGRALRQSLRF
jgi:hypothetical protein